MARVDVGNDLTGYVVKPGWKVSDDGYGLRTATIQFTTDVTNGVDFVRGEECPIAGYEYLHLHKQTSTMDALGIQIQVCDYVGIAPDVNEGNYTNPNTSSANGLTTENITSHPNFFVAADGYSGVIAGLSLEQSDIGPLVDIKDPADYVSKVIGQNSDGTPITAMVTKQNSWIGENGACFDNDPAGRFIGFVDPQFKSLYGKTNYLAATTSYSGIIYVADPAFVTDIIGYLNKATSTTAWGTWDLIPDWAIVGTVAGVGHVNLLSQVNVEEFGNLYKVGYEIRYAKYGWDSKVYINIEE